MALIGSIGVLGQLLKQVAILELCWSIFSDAARLLCVQAAGRWAAVQKSSSRLLKDSAAEPADLQSGAKLSSTNC